MAVYTLSGMVTISIQTEVEAESEEAAIKIGYSRPMVSLCHQCAGGDPTEEWITSGELDGEATDIIAKKI